MKDAQDDLIELNNLNSSTENCDVEIYNSICELIQFYSEIKQLSLKKKYYDI